MSAVLLWGTSGRDARERSGSNEGAVEQKADDGDHEGPDQRGPETVDEEVDPHALRDAAREQQHEGVDDEDEQPEGEDRERQAEEADDGPDDGIHDAEDQRHDE